MSDIKNWSNSAAGNTASSPNGWPEGMPPSGVNDSAREMMAAIRRQHEDADWINFGDTPVQQSATQFLISAIDRTTVYTVDRRLRLHDGSNTFYAYVSSATYSTNTIVNVVLNSGALTSSLSSVAVGIINPAYQSISSRSNMVDVSATASVGYINVASGGRSSSSFDVSGTLSAGFIKVGKTLDVSATASVGALRVGGAFDVSGSASLAGNLNIAGNLVVTGSVTAGTLSNVYTSGEIAIPTVAGNQATWTHSLTATPKVFGMKLICKSAEFNYSVNDIIDGIPNANPNGLWANSTTVGMTYQGNPFTATNKTTGVNVNLTSASWKIIFWAVL